MKLLSGQRFLLQNEKEFAYVKAGKVEVYAVTRNKSEFRQMILMTLEEGGAAFPALDEFKKIDVQIYAVEDSEIEIAPIKNFSVAEILPLMQNWFYKLVEISWLQLMAQRGDDILKRWQAGNFYTDSSGNIEDLEIAFRNNEQIFAMLLGVRFSSEDKKLSARMEVRARQKQRLIEESISNLLGEEIPAAEEISDFGKLEEATFIVRHIAQAFSMPTENISIHLNFTKKLDQLGLIRRLMQKGNMQMRLVTLTKNWYTQDSGVLIGYFGAQKELAAIIPTSPEKYKIITKTNPQGVEVTAEIAPSIDKDAFACYAGFPARKLKILDLWKFMLNQCWKNDYRTIIIVSFIAGLVPLVMPLITETVFHDIIPILDRRGLVTVTQVIMVTSFTTAALSIVRTIAMMRISTKLDMATEAALWSRLLNLPEKFFRQFQAGELANRMAGISAVKSVVNGGFVATLFNTIFSFWSLFLMCYYSLKLTAAAIAVWLVWCLVTAFIYRRVIGFQRNLINAENKEAGLLLQIFTGLAKFRVHGAEENAYNLWSKVFGETWKWNLKLRWQANYNEIISSVQPFILSMLLYYIAVYGMNEVSADGKIIASGIGYAQFLAFSAAYSSFNGTLNSLIPLVGQFFTIQPHIENLKPLLEEEPEVTDEKVDAEILSGALEVSHLTFAYAENKPNVLNDISFKVSAGENLAIVGKSGCGKSTLVRLLLGFEKPKSGAIFFDGQNLAEMNLASVRSQMGVVLQNGQLMTGDIFTNIVGTKNLTQEDAWRAAEEASIADDIRAMPMEMQTVISEGSSNISGGQRQRILIARALAAKPAILIFDEATSALDNRAQAVVTESIKKLNVTRIVIAHRLSTIRDCDKIIVMDKGKITESGTFEELVERGGLFAKLVKRQVT